MTFDCIVFFEYLVIELQTVEITNKALMPGIGLGKVKLFISIDRRIRSIILTDVLHVLQIKGNLIFIIKL